VLRYRLIFTSRDGRLANLVTVLPKTATGKIQKYVLRKGKSAIARQSDLGCGKKAGPVR
jgi:hypothetical protein